MTMPTLWIPTPLRDLTQGKSSVSVSGSTVREAIENLEVQFPGIKERLCENEKIRPNISVMVDGHVTHLRMRERLEQASEVHFVIAISGGARSPNFLRNTHHGEDFGGLAFKQDKFWQIM